MTSVEWFVNRGQRNLAAARKLYEDAFYDIAVSRAYYAMFYLASAVLLTRGHEYRRHGTLVAGFGYHLARPGILPARLQESLTEAFELRLRSDYGATGEIHEDVAAQVLRKAEEFVTLVKAFLEKE
jgi:uncharacterized protein (UPF0332 family)